MQPIIGDRRITGLSAEVIAELSAELDPLGHERQRIGPLLAPGTARANADATSRLRIVDGTLVPVRDRKAGASLRNYRIKANVQVVVDPESRPVPRDTVDAHAWRDSGPAQHCNAQRSSVTAPT
ncbi:hypothetical protein [Streptomyces tendae]|uniref:hypothetical protein n=1 Tax=Streptomyces tendae TaxID=1932 RepID=UPI00370FB7B1